MSEFAVVINYQFSGEKSTSIILDTVDDVDVGKSTTITSQPMVNGDEVSDHMFRKGATLSIRGTCSLNGSFSQGKIVDANGSRLANFESLFERIQNEAVRCTIYKIQVGTNNDVRFLHRENMVLESVQWKEKINSVNFTLSFKQILVADAVELDVDVDDAYLPNVTEPKTLSFTESLIDYEKIDAAVCDILEQESLWTSGFKTFLAGYGEAALKAAILGVAAGIIAGVLVALNTTPIGWVLTTVGLAIAAEVILIKGIVDAITEAIRKRKYAVETFKFYNNPNKDNEELERFADFIGGIHEEFKELDKSLHVYQVSANEPQEVMLSVYDDYYNFVFTKNNTNGHYSLSLSNIDKTSTKEISDITASPTDFYELTGANYLVKTSKNQRIYLVCPSDEKDDLTNYFIVVSDINPVDFNEIVNKIIKSKIFRNA